MSSVESCLADAEGLSAVDRYGLAMSILETLRGPLGAPKAKGSKGSKASGEPKAKRGQTSWNIGCEVVREAIKDLEGYKPPHVMAFAKVLKAADEAGWAKTEAADIAEQYAEWVKENSDVGSRSSGGSKAPKAPKAPKPEPTEEEKAAKRKLDAAKRKLKLEAKKAAAAAEAAAEVAVEAEELEEEKPAPKAAPKKVVKAPKKDDEKYDADGGADFKHEGVTYLRKKLALYNRKTEEFVGLWDPKSKTIDTDADEPEEE